MQISEETKNSEVRRGTYIVYTEDWTEYFFPVQHLAAVLGKRRYRWNSESRCKSSTSSVKGEMYV